MLYKLLLLLKPYLHGVDVFRYITFRTALATLTALLISLALGPWIIGRLKTAQPGKHVREYVPDSHLLKAGVPTMGGLLLLLAIVGSTLLWADPGNRLVWVTLGTFVGFGLIGFWDDWLKLYSSAKKGLTARTKFLLQVAVAGAVAVYLFLDPSLPLLGHSLQLPFFKAAVYSLGIFYIPFVMTVVIGTSNGVNLTDGLDGLAIGPVLFAALALAVLTYLSGNARFASYLNIVFVPEVGELTIFCGAMAGAALGFLWFNTYPAQVFMGDIGSLSLGAGLGLAAVLAKHEILLVLIGGLFVMETLSVIIQVLSFRYLKRRVFLMAPLHHHFEKKGWPEPKIIVRFWIISIILVLVALSTLKVR